MDFEARYQRLRADVDAVRKHIGDSTTPPAGLATVVMLDKLLDRHPPNYRIEVPHEDEPR